VAVKAIGAGQFGEVWLAKQAMKGGTPVMRAVKTLKAANANAADRQEFIREAECMFDFDHPNVTCIMGVAVQQPPWLTVLEFMEHGDLREVVISAARCASFDRSIHSRMPFSFTPLLRFKRACV
jgi:serine/threonine protein kinase